MYNLMHGVHSIFAGYLQFNLVFFHMVYLNGAYILFGQQYIMLDGV